MTIHALDKNLLVTSLPIAYRDRPAGSESKLSTYSDGARVLLTIFRLYRCYQPLRFFGSAALVLLILSLAFFLPVLADYFATGSVPRFPTLIVSSITMLAAALSFVCGLILDTHAVNARKTLEVQMNIIELLRRR